MNGGISWVIFYSEAISNISTVTQYCFSLNNLASTRRFGAAILTLYSTTP